MSTTAIHLARWRSFLNDTVAPYSWSDAELVEYGNRVVEELCTECFLIEDRSTVDDGTNPVCQITLVQDQIYYDVSDKVIAIIKAKVSSQTAPMALKDLEWMEDNMGDWEGQDSGIPRVVMIHGVGTSKVAVYPAADSDIAGDTVNMTVYRLPITEMSSALTTGSPEIPQKFQRYMDNGVYMYAYRKHDEDTENGLAQAHMGYFAADKEKIKWEIIREKSIHRTPTIDLAFM